MWNEKARDIRRWRESKGFVTPTTIQGQDANDMLGKLMLVVTEVCEAMEGDANGDIPNYREELADAAIRILDICGTMELQIDDEMAKQVKILDTVSPVDVIIFISHAAENVRHGNRDDFMAHLCWSLRYLDVLCLEAGAELMVEVDMKMLANWQRPHLHGKLTTL